MDNQVLIALVGVIYILAEVIKFRALKKQNGNFTTADRQMLSDLHNLLIPVDKVPPDHRLKAIHASLKILEKWECPCCKNPK